MTCNTVHNTHTDVTHKTNHTGQSTGPKKTEESALSFSPDRSNLCMKCKMEPHAVVNVQTNSGGVSEPRGPVNGGAFEMITTAWSDHNVLPKQSYLQIPKENNGRELCGYIVLTCTKQFHGFTSAIIDHTERTV
jgi:hypothetical protein